MKKVNVKNIVVEIVRLAIYAFASVIFFKMMFGVMATPAEDVVEKVYYYFFGIGGIVMYTVAFIYATWETINHYRNKA